VKCEKWRKKIYRTSRATSIHRTSRATSIYRTSRATSIYNRVNEEFYGLGPYMIHYTFHIYNMLYFLYLLLFIIIDHYIINYE
jgi:hypothetical protein